MSEAKNNRITRSSKGSLQGRQRTICDKCLWSYNRLHGCTVEDKYLLIYFLTSPYSNIIGVYEIKLASVAAELGWDVETQFKPVLKRLVDEALVDYDEESYFVWVKVWWDHNVPSQAAGERLIGKTVEELLRMPAKWHQDYLEDYSARAPSKVGRLYNLLDQRLRSQLTEQSKANLLNSIPDQSQPDNGHHVGSVHLQRIKEILSC
ncbi:TPA: hypothetical protein ACKRMY_006256 [Pseudomonas aeruginosa]